MLRWPLLYFEVAFLVHALSHFVVARAAGLTVATFAIGIGPRIFRFNHRGKAYRLNLLPVGAYTVIDLPSGSSPEQGSVVRSLTAVAAGPLSNFILSSTCFMLIAMLFGVASGISNKIGTLVPGYPAAEAGLRPGDKIVMIDGTPMADGEMIVRTIHSSGGRALAFLVERDGGQVLIHVSPRYDARTNVWVTGFSPAVVRQQFDPAHALGWGTVTTLGDIVAYFSGVWQLFRPAGQFALSGPMTAMNILSQATTVGPEAVLFMLAFANAITVALNLIPIPPLDCGRAVLLVTEGPRWRRVRYVLFIGLGLLLALIVRSTLTPARIPPP